MSKSNLRDRKEDTLSSRFLTCRWPCLKLTNKVKFLLIFFLLLYIRRDVWTKLFSASTPLDNVIQIHNFSAVEDMPKELKKMHVFIEDARKEFWSRYGGKQAAMNLLSRGILSFDEPPVERSKNGRDTLSNTKVTAERILRALATTNSFIMAFGGYSITVGRGNYFNQSYPFIIERVLSPVAQIMGLDLVVRNSAIGGVPAFPYGWCLPNFLGQDADVISWDYGMNGNGGSELEAYVRHGMIMDRQPMLIMMGNSPKRVDMLHKYSDQNSYFNPIAVNYEHAADTTILEMDEARRPVGYQHWDDWGTPKGSSGQVRWHLKYMHHELIGWMIAMHFLEGFSEAVHIMATDQKWKSKYSTLKDRSALQKPLTNAFKSIKNTSSLMYGNPPSSNGTYSKNWIMNHVSCRTSFTPAVNGGLLDMIESGLFPPKNDPEKVMNFTAKDSDFKNSWIVDIGKWEKSRKYPSLGYVDMKTAVYGLAKSGTIKFFLPYEASKNYDSAALSSSTMGVSYMGEGSALKSNASHWFRSLVMCEVNEERQEFDECDPARDFTIVIGGAEAKRIVKIDEIFYKSKKICIMVDIPVKAKMIKRDDNSYGMNLHVTVKNSALVYQAPCSISHIVWENAP